MRTIMIITVAAISLMAMGCGEAERLGSELAVANARVAVLDSALTNTQRDLGEAIAHTEGFEQLLETVQGERDDLAEYLKSANIEVRHLGDELRAARAEYSASVDSLEAVNFALQIDLNRWKAEVENSAIRVRATERQANEFIHARDSLYEFVDAVRPWYDYYTQEAGRGWTAKLFGAGRAVEPGSPEPVVVRNEVTTRLEVLGSSLSF